MRIKSNHIFVYKFQNNMYNGHKHVNTEELFIFIGEV